ncbi:hypothetical protein CS0771_56500 [Catellatospora sp. IY07-71]|nr:hypothetical protein CS0771_56500 [Catellatospora sp. IY07-71]
MCDPPTHYKLRTAFIVLGPGETRHGRDHGPACFAAHNEALAQVIPGARTLRLPRARHDAIAIAPARLVDPIAEFLAAPEAAAR